MNATPVSLLTLAARIRRFELIVLPVFSVIVAGIIVVQGGRSAALDRDGVETTGTVVSFQQQLTPRDGERMYQNRTVIAFTTEDGEARRHVHVSRPHREGASTRHPRRSVGDTVSIRYVRSDPSVVELGVESAGRQHVAAVVMLALLGAWFLVAAASGLLRAAQGIRTRDKGERTVVAVADASELGVRVAPREFVWRLPDGTIGRSLSVPSRARKPQPGERITVYVLDGRTWWEGDTGPRRAS